MAAHFAHVRSRRRHKEALPGRLGVLGQELGGSGTVGRFVVAISQASQSKELVGERLVLRCRPARSPGAGGDDLDVPVHPGPAGEAVPQPNLGPRPQWGSAPHPVLARTLLSGPGKFRVRSTIVGRLQAAQNPKNALVMRRSPVRFSSRAPSTRRFVKRSASEDSFESSLVSNWSRNRPRIGARGPWDDD